MTTSPTVDPQHVSQLVTEEWMMMPPPSSSSSSSSLLPPTFLEIMFLKETEQYLYTKFLPALLTEINTKCIRPFVHQLLISLLKQQQKQQPPPPPPVKADFVENENSIQSTTHKIHTVVLFWKRIYNFLHRIQTMVRRRYIQTYLLPMMIRMVTHIDTYLTNTTGSTNNNHYRLEVIYLLRYILDRYTLIKYHCTFVELLYGGRNMIRKKETVMNVLPLPLPPVIKAHHPNDSTTTTTTTTTMTPTTTVKLLPLQRNDQIRTALLFNLMEYLYEKSKQLLYNNNRKQCDVDHNNQHSKCQQRIIRIISPYISIVSNLYYIFNHIYYPYQYLIGTSYYMNLSNRLLQQILLLQHRPQQLPPVSTPTDHSTNQSSTIVPVNTVPSSSSSSFTWYMTTLLRTSGIVLLTGCYVTQMIQYYIQRRRTLRQEQLILQVQRQELSSSSHQKRRNHHIGITNFKHPNTNPKNNDDDDTSTMDIESLPLQRFHISSSDVVDILPVPLLPNDIQKSRLLQDTIYHQKGYCPICQQPIHPLNSTLKTTTTTISTTMLYGYVYCSYTCIYQYLLHHNHICPMTGRLVQHLSTTTTTTTPNTTGNTTTSTENNPPQLIRLL